MIHQTKGENVEEVEIKSGGRSPKKCQSSSGDNGSNTDVKTAEDTAEKGCEIEHIAPNNLTLALTEQSQKSITDQNGEGIDPTEHLIE